MNNRSNNTFINNKNKTYKQKNKKNESFGNVKKKYIKPFPLKNLNVSNSMNNKSNILENIKNLWKKVIYYYINELLSSTLIFNNSFNNSSIEGKLIVLNNYMTKNIMEHKDSKSKVTFIIISEKKSINNCWNNGFYGKGNLSRSEPIWSEKILKDLMKRNSGINNQNLKNLLDNSRLSGIENNDINNSYSFLNNLIKLKAMSSKILSKKYFLFMIFF